MDERMGPTKLTEEERDEINQRDLEKTNAAIDYLTHEAADLDLYQAPLDDRGWELETDAETTK